MSAIDDRDRVAGEQEDRELHKAVWKCDTDAEVIALIRSREAPLLAGKREAEALKRAWDLVAAEFPGPHEGWAADGPGELMVQAVRSLRAQLASAHEETARRLLELATEECAHFETKAQLASANARVEELEKALKDIAGMRRLRRPVIAAVSMQRIAEAALSALPEARETEPHDCGGECFHD